MNTKQIEELNNKFKQLIELFKEWEKEEEVKEDYTWIIELYNKYVPHTNRFFNEFCVDVNKVMPKISKEEIERSMSLHTNEGKRYADIFIDLLKSKGLYKE